MGQVKAYAEWAKDKGHLDKNYKTVDPEAHDMQWASDFVKERNANTASSRLLKANAILKLKETKWD